MPENVKAGSFEIFKHPFCCKLSKQSKGELFGAIQKFWKKSHSAEKNLSEKHQVVFEKHQKMPKGDP